MKRSFLLFVLLTFTILTLVACGDGQSDASTDLEGKNEGSLRFAFLPNTQNNTFQTAMNETYEKLAKEHGYGYTMLDPDYDLNKQLNQMSDASNQDFDAVFVIPVDSSGIRMGLQQFKDRGIPVFNVDTAVFEEDRDLVESIVATDAYMAGELMGQQMAEDYPDGAKIAILDFPSNESCILRVEGFLAGLGDNLEKFEIVAQQDGKAALDVSLPIAEDIIQANPDLDAFFAINDPSALGVAAAVGSSGKDIDVYSIDASPEGKEALLDGSFTAVSAQVPVQIAEESFKAAVELVNGGEVEKEIYLPSHIVTQEMAEETAGEWQ